MVEEQQCACCNSGYEADYELMCLALGQYAFFCAMCMHMRCNLGEDIESCGHYVHRFTLVLTVSMGTVAGK